MAFPFTSNIVGSFGTERIIKCLVGICFAVGVFVVIYFFGHRMSSASVNELNGKYMSLMADLELAAVKAQREGPSAKPEDDAKPLLNEPDVPSELHEMVDYSADFTAETHRLFSPRYGVNGRGHPVIYYPFGEWYTAYSKIQGNPSSEFDQLDVYLTMIDSKALKEHLLLDNLDIILNMGGKGNGTCNSFTKDGEENCLNFVLVGIPDITETTYFINTPPTDKAMKRILSLKELLLNVWPSVNVAPVNKEEVASLFPL